jgi:hypothetical protein
LAMMMMMVMIVRRRRNIQDPESNPNCPHRSTALYYIVAIRDLGLLAFARFFSKTFE